MTAGQTNHARHERKKAEFEAELNDRKRAIEICREIRDKPDSSDADRLKAIELLAQYTAGSRRPA